MQKVSIIKFTPTLHQGKLQYEVEGFISASSPAAYVRTTMELASIDRWLNDHAADNVKCYLKDCELPRKGISLELRKHLTKVSKCVEPKRNAYRDLKRPFMADRREGVIDSEYRAFCGVLMLQVLKEVNAQLSEGTFRDFALSLPPLRRTMAEAFGFCGLAARHINKNYSKETTQLWLSSGLLVALHEALGVPRLFPVGGGEYLQNEQDYMFASLSKDWIEQMWTGDEPYAKARRAYLETIENFLTEQLHLAGVDIPRVLEALKND